MGSVLCGVLVADILTKIWALRALADGRQIDLFGGWVPLTLAFNRGAAFGFSVGSDPRWFFIPVTLVAIGFLVHLIRQAAPGDTLRIVSSSLVLAGATGNLIDRVRWNEGVVDFIGPIDLGFMLWPIFNIADSSITTGGLLLAVSLWMEDSRARQAPGMDDAKEGSTGGETGAPSPS